MEKAILLAVLLLAACSSAQHAKGPALHSIQDQRLRELMAEMNSLIMSEKEMTDLQRDARRREYNLKMAKTAEAMGRTVDAIIANLPGLKLSPTEQATFLALADKLRGGALELKDLAGNNRSDAIPAELERIETTCKSCHRLFRPTGG